MDVHRLDRDQILFVPRDDAANEAGDDGRTQNHRVRAKDKRRFRSFQTQQQSDGSNRRMRVLPSVPDVRCSSRRDASYRRHRKTKREGSDEEDDDDDVDEEEVQLKKTWNRKTSGSKAADDADAGRDTVSGNFQKDWNKSTGVECRETD